jgi:pimeloyl-ACP methyl ester carboxylesterase
MKTNSQLLQSGPASEQPAGAISAPQTPGVETVKFRSLGDDLVGSLFLPATLQPAPGLIVCHGAGDLRDNYAELCETLARRGVACLALDMHGHGQSGGARSFVDMREWVADVRAAIGFLSSHPRIAASKIGAFGISSGGTAILEAAVIEPRLKALVALDATVYDSLPAATAIPLKIFLALGKIKMALTNRPLRLPLAKMGPAPVVASDPEVNRRLMDKMHEIKAFMSYPLPGGEQAFFVDTIERVPQIAAPTLVIWGEEDKLDPPETGRKLFAALTCVKRLEIVPGNGHAGHMDRNRAKVFELTGDWLLEKMTGDPVPVGHPPPAR